MAGQAGALREVFARFGVTFDAGPLVRGEGATNDAATALRTLGNVVAGSALVVGLRNFNNEMVAIGDGLGATANLLGVNTRELQEWHLAAELADVSAADFDGAVLRLQNRMAQGGSGVAVFRRLGVDIRDAQGQLRNTSDVLTDLADPISRLSNDAERTGILVDLLGRSGARLAPLFSQGAAGIRSAREQLQELGGGASDEFIAAAQEQNDAIHRWDVAWLSLRSRLAVYVLPIFEAITVGLTRLSAGLTNATGRSRLLESAMVVLGIAGAAAGTRTALAWIRAAAPFLALAALVVGLTLVVDDLWVGLDGGESVLADLGVAFETWANGLIGEGGVFRRVGLAIEYIRGLVISFASTVFDMANAAASLVGAGENAFGRNLLADQNPGQDGAPESAAAGRIYDAGHQSPAEFLLPDSFERVLAIEAARGAVGDAAGTRPAPAAPAAPARTDIRIDRIDTSGLTQEQAARMVETGITRALDRHTADILDANT